MGNNEAADRAKLEDPCFAERYRAIRGRDTRFDGQFFTGVASTGVYCRPSCPAPAALPRNITFYRTAAAAHEAGLRACKRCLPDTVPGSPEWNRRDNLAMRAVRLISDGYVEREGVPGLARRLGYTPRHLSRVLVGELGAGPLALARAQRAHTARLLLRETTLPVGEVAFAAGFASIRQFNDTIRQVYGRTPSELRRMRGGERDPRAAAQESAQRIELRLPVRAPFDGEGLLHFLADRAVEGMEEAGEGWYRRTLRLPHGPASVRVELAGERGRDHVRCEASLSDVADLATLVGRLRRLFDLDADAVAIDEVLSRDPALAPGVRAVPGIRLPGAVDAQEILFRALIGQQISVAAARTLLGRLTAALGEPTADGLLFPEAAAIAEHGREHLRGPGCRVETIVTLAEALATEELTIDVGDTVTDLRERLVAYRGVGPWTAGYVALRVLGSPNLLLASDLGIRHGAERLGLPSEARALTRYSAAWSPWGSYAGMHLWRAAGDERRARERRRARHGKR